MKDLISIAMATCLIMMIGCGDNNNPGGTSMDAGHVQSDTDDAQTDVVEETDTDEPDYPDAVCEEGTYTHPDNRILVVGLDRVVPKRSPYTVTSSTNTSFVLDDGMWPLEFRYPDLTGMGVTLPTPGQEVLVTGVECGGPYALVETLEGELLWDGGWDSCGCSGNTDGIERVCNEGKRIRFDFETPNLETPACRLPLSELQPDIPPERQKVWTTYDVLARTDNGDIRLKMGEIRDVLIDGRPFRVFNFLSGHLYCPPPSADCTSFHSSSVALPIAEQE